MNFFILYLSLNASWCCCFAVVVKCISYLFFFKSVLVWSFSTLWDWHFALVTDHTDTLCWGIWESSLPSLVFFEGNGYWEKLLDFVKCHISGKTQGFAVLFHPCLRTDFLIVNQFPIPSKNPLKLTFSTLWQIKLVLKFKFFFVSFRDCILITAFLSSCFFLQILPHVPPYSPSNLWHFFINCYACIYIFFMYIY